MDQPRKLFNKNFVLIWLGQGVSGIGSTAYSIAMMYWIFEATGSATLMGLLTMSSQLPGFILGPIGGTLADFFSRRTIIIASDFINGLAILTITALFYLEPNATNLIMTWVFVVAILNGITGAFFGPAISAAFPDLVPKEKLAKANSLMGFTGRIGALVGLGMGGVIYSWLGPLALFFINGLSFIFSGISECFITIPQKIPEKKQTDWVGKFRHYGVETGKGFRYIWGRKGLRTLIFGSAAWNIFTVPFRVLLIPFIEKFLRVDPSWYGFLVGALLGGSMFGLSLFGIVKFTPRSRLGFMVVLPILTASILMFFGTTPNVYVVFSLFFIIGINGAIFDLNVMTLIQSTTQSEIRGRVFSVLRTLAQGLTPISMGLSGVVADMLDQNIPFLFLMCGVCLMIITLSLSSNRNYRRFVTTPIASDKDQNSEPKEEKGEEAADPPAEKLEKTTAPGPERPASNP